MTGAPFQTRGIVPSVPVTLEWGRTKGWTQGVTKEVGVERKGGQKDLSVDLSVREGMEGQNVSERRSYEEGKDKLRANGKLCVTSYIVIIMILLAIVHNSQQMTYGWSLDSDNTCECGHVISVGSTHPS